jgi:hypothetical protein
MEIALYVLIGFIACIVLEFLAALVGFAFISRYYER